MATCFTLTYPESMVLREEWTTKPLAGFLPLMNGLKTIPLESDSGRLLIQAFSSPAMGFAFVQSDAKNPYPLYLDIPDPCLLFLAGLNGLSTCHLSGHPAEEVHMRPFEQRLLSVPVGRHHIDLNPGIQRFYLVSVQCPDTVGQLAAEMFYLYILQAHLNDPAKKPASFLAMPFTQTLLNEINRLARTDKKHLSFQLYYQERIHLILLNYYKKLSAYLEDDGDIPEEPLPDRIIDYIRENYADPDLTVAKMAAHFNVSVSTVDKAFRDSAIKMKPYLSLVRMNNAHQMIFETDLPLAEIGFLVGCQHPSNFARLYKKFYHVLPSENLKHRKGVILADNV